MPARAPVLVDLKFNSEGSRSHSEDRLSGSRQHQSRRSGPIRVAISRGIEYALLWKPDADLFDRAPNLKVVFSGGAGVDSILTLPGLPDVPIVRFVDRSLTTRMSEWVVMQCLMHLRQQREHDRHQRASHLGQG